LLTLVLLFSSSLSSSSSTKSITVARLSCDLKKYSCKEAEDLLPLLCQASVSPQSSESYSDSEAQSSESENSTATLLARIVATSDIPCPLLFSIAALASTFFSAMPSLMAFNKSDLTSSWGFLTIGGAFFSCGGEVIVDIFLGEEFALGREPLSLISPFSAGAGGGGGGGGGGGAAAPVGAGGGAVVAAASGQVLPSGDWASRPR